jgi:hypothetical protein
MRIVPIYILLGLMVLPTAMSGIVSANSNVGLLENQVAFSDESVKLLSTQDGLREVAHGLSESTSKVSLTTERDLSSLKYGEDILIVDERSLGSEKIMSLTDELKTVLIHGTPIIMLSDSSAILSDIADDLRISYGYAVGGSAYGLKYDPLSGISYALCIGAEQISVQTINENLIDAYVWGVDKLQNKARAHDSLSLTELKTYDISPDGAPPADARWYQVTQLEYNWNFNPYGKLNIRTIYEKIANDGDPSYSYYAAHYILQSVPGRIAWGNYYHTSDMVIQTVATVRPDYPGQVLQTYKPTSSSGSYTTTAGLQANVGTDSAGFSLGISWGYTTDFVTIQDQSDYSLQKAQWLHDVREDQNPGHNTYQIEPGATFKVPGEIYGYYDLYSIRWCKGVYNMLGWLLWHEDYQWKNVYAYGTVWS